MDITTATPAQVDTALAAIQIRLYDVWDATAVTRRYLDDAVAGNARREAGDYSYSSYTQASVERLEAKMADQRAQARAIEAEMAPFEVEFDNRGGWTRAFLVTNAGGHVHRSTWCNTCFPTTRFAWLPQYSGQDEAEIVADAGQSACTVCYPSAPVEVLARPSKIEEPAKRSARLEREAAKAEREAKKAAKAITTPGGGALRVDRGGWPQTLATLARAKMWLTDAHGWGLGAHPYYSVADGQAVAEAIAAKVGTTAEVEMAAAAVRSAKRR